MPTLDITDYLVWTDELPRPNWDVLGRLVVKQPEANRTEAWNDIARQWLEHLGKAAGPDYAWCEGKNTLVLGPKDDRLFRALTSLGDASQRTLTTLMPGFAEFRTPGKLVVLTWQGSDDYYRYLGRFHGAGEFGASAGMHIRDDHPHIALCHVSTEQTATTLAHETTHASLAHHDLPQWLEEGLAQMFESDMTGRRPLMLEPKQAAKHRKYWNRNGLDGFWYGESFHRSGDAQELSYQLAEILVRLLFSDYRPGWFSRGKQKQLMAFLGNADRRDAGRESADIFLDHGLDDLAAKFLGPIEKKPSTKQNPNNNWRGDFTRD